VNHTTSNLNIPFPKLTLFWALSRTPHAIVDLATPALAALLCLGYFPPIHITLLGILTMFAGYTAVYALNDMVDFRNDKKKVAFDGYKSIENDSWYYIFKHDWLLNIRC